MRNPVRVPVGLVFPLLNNFGLVMFLLLIVMMDIFPTDISRQRQNSNNDENQVNQHFLPIDAFPFFRGD